MNKRVSRREEKQSSHLFSPSHPKSADHFGVCFCSPSAAQTSSLTSMLTMTPQCLAKLRTYGIFMVTDPQTFLQIHKRSRRNSATRLKSCMHANLHPDATPYWKRIGIRNMAPKS